MRRTSALAALSSAALSSAGFLVAAGTAAPATAAPTGLSVHIVAHTSFSSDVSDFESNIEGCETGTVVNGADATAHFTPWGGNFIGDKEFTCDGGASGFTVRLKARFGGGGSTGSWNVAGGWGELAGLKGSGMLVGIPISQDQLDDVYTGSVR